MDQPHSAGAWADPPARSGVTAPGPAPGASDTDRNVPQDDDERFIVGLVLTYYRRHPERAKTRLLDLLGEVLTPAPAPPPPAAAKRGDDKRGARTADDDRALWNQTQAAVAPLKRKR